MGFTALQLPCGFPSDPSHPGRQAPFGDFGQILRIDVSELLGHQVAPSGFSGGQLWRGLENIWRYHKISQSKYEAFALLVAGWMLVEVCRILLLLLVLGISCLEVSHFLVVAWDDSDSMNFPALSNSEMPDPKRGAAFAPGSRSCLGFQTVLLSMNIWILNMQLPQNGALCPHDPPWKCWYCWCNTRKLRTQRCAYVEYEASSLPHQVIQSTTLWLS